MVVGLLEVFLIEGKGLKGTDFIFDKIDPYVVIKYKGQQKKSSVAKGQGSNPKWNERFTFRAEFPGSGGDFNLNFKLMDQDTFSADDYLGHAKIYVKDILELGCERGSYEVHPTKHSVVDLNDRYCGELKVGLTFTARPIQEGEEEEMGGWSQSGC